MGDSPPTEFLIFSAGVNETQKGPFTFDAEAARSVMSTYATEGVDLMIDLEHESLSPQDECVRPDCRDARGWFQLSLRPDGSLWAVNVRWSPDGARRLAEKTQRYISPAFFDEDGRVMALVNAALCARPATYDARPLVAASQRRLAHRDTRDTLTLTKMDPAQVKAALDAIEAGDSAKALEILKALIATAAGGDAAPPADAPPADPTAESADGAPPPAAPASDPKAATQMTALAATFRSEMASMKAAIVTATTALASINTEYRAAESTKRAELVGELVKLGAETPATAWADAEKKIPCKRLAAEPVADMAKRVEQLSVAYTGVIAHEPPTAGTIDVSSLTPRQLALCAKNKITPEEFVVRLSGAVRRFSPNTETE